MKFLYSILTTISLIIVILSQPTNAADAAPEKFEFQAEVSRMMDIIINSLYQKKEVFLREVISNGADALDKIRFLSLQHPEELDSKKELEIRISYNEDLRTLTIRDTGIGMTKQEVIENLGTVAKSGTTNFVEQLSNTGDVNLIGQFGVGFYSVYLVADKVIVRTKNNKDENQYIWESTADSTFTVSQDTDGEPLGRGTEITLHLKEDALEYMSASRLQYLIERYSEFVGFPIYIYKQEVIEEPEDEEDDSEYEDDEDDDDEEDDEEEEAGEESSEPKMEWKWVQINTQPAIWTRSSSEIEESEYQEFYKAIAKTTEDPLTWTHFKAEGEVEFKSILFIPKNAPYNQYDQYYTLEAALKLYVRKVLIKDDFKELLPRYLNFIKGVVDSDDLPLSVSRETLQQAKAVKVIGKKLIRKTLDMLAKMASKEEENRAENEEEDDEIEDDDEDEREVAKFSDFYKQFGKNIKLGVIEDTNNRDRLTKLLRYRTTKTENGEAESAGGLTSLEAYVSRMKPWQKSIFYLTGENTEALLASPFLQKALSKDIEVVLMDEPVDEYVLQQMKKFDNLPLQSLAKDGVKFGDETDLEQKQEEEYKKMFKELTNWMKTEVYNKPEAGGKSDTVSKILVTTTRIDENLPAVVVSSKYGNSATMERLMMSQALGDTAKRTIAQATKIMEINPRNPIVAKLRDIYETDEEQARDIAWLLFDTARVSSGFDISDKSEFAKRMFRLMQSGLQLSNLAPLPMIEVPEEEEDEIDVEEEEKEEL